MHDEKKDKQEESEEDTVSRLEIKRIIKQLKKKEISVFAVPEEYKNNMQIVNYERKKGLRIIEERGFDIISNSFFVNEAIIQLDTNGARKKRSSLLFDDFDSYYYFLNGDIYNNACYTFCFLPENIINSYRIRLKRLMKRQAFVQDTIDSYSLSTTSDEILAYSKTTSDIIKHEEECAKQIVDETIKMPMLTDGEAKYLHSTDGKMTYSYSVEKYYCEGKFYVKQKWEDERGVAIKGYIHTFDYFFDFVAFLKGDLSNADLLFCEGLDNLEKNDSINFTGAKLRSSFCEKFGVQCDAYHMNQSLIESFECIESNESKTALVLQSSRDLAVEAEECGLSKNDCLFGNKCQRVHYISDIHLMHKIQNEGCHSKEDVIYAIPKIVNAIAADLGSLLLIGGDVASDIEVFELFVKSLSKTFWGKQQVVFVLGNHELWGFPELQIEQIVSKYRAILEKYGMYLLHNDLFYKEKSEKRGHLISYYNLCKMNDTQIADCLRNAEYVILGGLGFSGYNLKFNANNGVYKMTIDRTAEIRESKKFEALYNRLRPVLDNKNTIILTHAPKRDWCGEEKPDKNYVYVNGHTHRNYFYDDGEYRVYSDNQLGYRSENPRLKAFLIDNDYDCFFDYEDGIFEITGDQYRNFYRGKNIPMTFNREVNVLYMLKKKGYYCFIHKSKNGDLAILNGGNMKKLQIRDIHYYYDNMDAMISTIKEPLDKYTSYQKQIANMVKKIGGQGTIHGCIIDIDFYNHLFVNPFDTSIIGYWAFDMINKMVYPSISALLEQNCPAIYGEYAKFLNDNNENPLALKQEMNIKIRPQEYTDTDFYKISREIKKMQKVNTKILSSWYENVQQDKRTQGRLT